MDVANERALSIMRGIINDYLDKRMSREETVDRLLVSIDIDVIHRTDAELMVTDCYYSIKHLTENGYETTDFELAYFRECFDGAKKYDMDEKMNLARKHIQSAGNS